MTKKILINEKVEQLNKILNGFEKDEFDLDRGIEEYKNAKEIIKEIESELNAKELELKEINSGE
ncbi:exodeoxyribonuclease VII small subunit [Candidatus Dojkabacteria bacterium]|nr:exodeoxyribonuclease VII small subunit [Candidatus Dojkabacteria bacterium]